MATGATSTFPLDSLKSVYLLDVNQKATIYQLPVLSMYQNLWDNLPIPQGWVSKPVPYLSLQQGISQFFGQLFLADGTHCKTKAFYSAIPLSVFFDCKISSLVASEVFGIDLNVPQRDAWSEQPCSIGSKRSQPSMKQHIRCLGVRVLSALSFHVPGSQPWSHCPERRKTGRP